MTIITVWWGYRLLVVSAAAAWVWWVVRRDTDGSPFAAVPFALLVWSVLWLVGAFVKPLVLDMELRAY
jgi:uncharacterized membrane protein YvlD (DUF360 family)